MENIETTSNETTAIESSTPEETVNSIEQAETTESTESTVIETENTQDSTKNVSDTDRFTKAFSQRFNKEREKLTAKYSPMEKVIGIAAKNFGMSAEEYIESILSDYQEEEETGSNELDEKEQLLNELLAQKREQEYSQEWEKISNELKMLNENIKADDITDDMLEFSSNTGIPLQFVYAYDLLTNKRDGFLKGFEEKTIAKMSQINKGTGSLQSAPVGLNSNISSMKKDDFEKLIEKVKRGEIRNLN